MRSQNLYLTLALASFITFVFTLSLYALVFQRNPLNRLGYGVFVSVTPALLALVVAKVTRVSLRAVVVIYIVLLALVVVLQGVG